MEENRQRIEIYRADTSSSLELPYANAGIQAGFPGPGLSGRSPDTEKHARIMAVMDKLNSGFDDHLLSLGSQGIGKKWKLRRNKLSQEYTTDINQILEVKAG